MVNAKFLMIGAFALFTVVVAEENIENDAGHENNVERFSFGDIMDHITSHSKDHTDKKPKDMSLVSNTLDQAPSATVDSNKALNKTLNQDKPKDQEAENSTEMMTVVWPVAFSKICHSLMETEVALGHILDKYIANGAAECTNEQRNIINSPLSCSNADRTTNLISQFVWPLALKGIRATANKVNAQAQCLSMLSAKSH